MPSELNVNKISPASGTSVTLGDSGDTFTIPSGLTLSGSGASLTSLPAANLTGTLPAISGASLTNLPGGLTLGTAVATTSGNTIDFTGIPSGTKRITVSVDGISVGSGTSAAQIQLGDSGGFETSGYLGSGLYLGSGGIQQASITTGMAMMPSLNATVALCGAMVITLLDASTFTWVSTFSAGRSDNTTAYTGSSSKSLSAELTQIRLTTVAGNLAWDAGKINISYE